MKDLPIGICRTYFFNGADRKEKLESKKRPCFVAYAGMGATYKSQRFPIDKLGEQEALDLAIRWRDARGPLHKRQSDITRKLNKSRRKSK